jgi:hypothetical protein
MQKQPMDSLPKVLVKLKDHNSIIVTNEKKDKGKGVFYTRISQMPKNGTDKQEDVFRVPHLHS